MYNASLAVYYVMVIVKGYKNKEVEKIEPLFHINAILWGAGTAFASLGLTLFNQVGWDCWISAAPLGCKESWTLEPGEVTTCERGDNGSLYQWAFYYAVSYFCAYDMCRNVPVMLKHPFLTASLGCYRDGYCINVLGIPFSSSARECNG